MSDKNQLTPIEQKWNLADLILEKRDEIIKLQSELTAARDEAEKAQAKADNCEREARQWRQEARTQSSIVAEIYEAVTGKKGEPGDRNGAEPVRAEIERLRGRVSELEAREDAMCDLHYANGAKAGFSLGQMNDNDRLESIVAKRMGPGVRELKRLRQQADSLENGE